MLNESAQFEEKNMEKLTSCCSSGTSVLLTDLTVIHTTGREGRGGGGENQMLGVIHMQADTETALCEVLCEQYF